MAPKLKVLGRVGNREVVLAWLVPGPKWLEAAPSTPWVALVLADSDHRESELRGFAKCCLLAGARYVCCVGPSAETIESAFDREISELGLVRTDEETICTTCDRTLTEGLWFSLYAAFHPTLELQHVVCLQLESREIAKEITVLVDRFNSGWVPPDEPT